MSKKSRIFGIVVFASSLGVSFAAPSSLSSPLSSPRPPVGALKILGPQRLVDFRAGQNSLTINLPVRNAKGAVKWWIAPHNRSLLKVVSQNSGRNLQMTIQLYDNEGLMKLRGLRLAASDSSGQSDVYLFPGVQQFTPMPPILKNQAIYPQPTDPVVLGKLSDQFKKTGRIAYGHIYINFYPEHARLFSDPIGFVRGLNDAYAVMANMTGFAPQGGKPIGFKELCPLVDPSATADQRKAINDQWKAKDPSTGAYLRSDCPNGMMEMEAYAYESDPISLREGTVELGRVAHEQNIPTIHLILLHEMAHAFDQVTDSQYGPVPAHLFSNPTVETWADMKVISMIDALVAKTGLGVRQWDRNFYSTAAMADVYLDFERGAFAEHNWSFEDLHNTGGHGRIGHGNGWQAHEVFSGILLKLARQFGDHPSRIVNVMSLERAHPRQLVSDYFYGFTTDLGRFFSYSQFGSDESMARVMNIFAYELSAHTGHDYASALQDQYGFPVDPIVHQALQGQFANRYSFMEGLEQVMSGLKFGFYVE